tara:strand:- start:219 stop:476 length:258 start_codon:yes stop_codon:yes gene_type:complete
MKDKDNKLIYEASREPLHWSTRIDDIKNKQRDAEIPRLACYASDCMHWSAGDKCVAEKVELSRVRGRSFAMTVICETYTTTGEDS